MTFLETVDHSLWRRHPAPEHYPEPAEVSRLSQAELEEAIVDRIMADFAEKQQLVRSLVGPLFEYSPVVPEPLFRPTLILNSADIV